MRIDLHARGFELTNQTRDFVQSRLLSALGQSMGHVGSVAVSLSTARGRSQPDTTRCGIVVSLRPSGEVRGQAEHEWLHVAIDRAAAEVGAAVERRILQTRPAVSPAAVVRSAA